MSENILELKEIRKSFGEAQVLRGISLCIHKGEFITFLGSSGCGKTTTLRIIAGLETPDSGSVLLDGRDVTALEPNKRDVNTIFQNYALFPHMNVFSNIAYSLKLRRVPKEEIRHRVKEMLSLVQLEGFERRMPNELSGGQRQRVAIARAVINNPSVLLLDEPLGALDLQLRRQMQQELKKLQKKLGITFLYITHDQEEAINMSDRIVVMNDGRFEQIGAPAEIYDRPKTSFVAGFIGMANIFQGEVISIEEGMAIIQVGEDTVCAAAAGGMQANDRVSFAVRSENLLVAKEPHPHFRLPAVVSENSYVGGMLRLSFTLSDGRTVISSKHGIRTHISLGQQVYLCWEPENAVFVDRGEVDEAQE
ncbi:MAG: ABC transporter ATP-binding protein [Provencibacterium sp.]|nr:ABC transporter ATP-binding protein [Provencibacterium sp.]